MYSYLGQPVHTLGVLNVHGVVRCWPAGVSDHGSNWHNRAEAIRSLPGPGVRVRSRRMSSSAGDNIPPR